MSEHGCFRFFFRSVDGACVLLLLCFMGFNMSAKK